jgi:short-subunit dehydrogenase
MNSLDGQRVLVTGAAGGIGSLVAARLRRAGAHVTGIDRIDCDGCDSFVAADLGTEEGIAALISQLDQVRCDMLVNMAGLQYCGPLTTQPPASLWAGYVVNLIAPAMLCQAVLPAMIARGHGRIVNIGSMLGVIPFAHFAGYSSTKAGLKGLSDALRRELAGSGVGVTHISPRAVRTATLSPAILKFAAATGMHLDQPDKVAERIVLAIAESQREVRIGVPERLFAVVNSLAPALVDRALAGNDRKAAALFR